MPRRTPRLNTMPDQPVNVGARHKQDSGLEHGQVSGLGREGPGTWILLNMVSLDLESWGGSAGGPADEKEAMATWLGEAVQHISIFTFSFRKPEKRWDLGLPEKSL